MGFVIVCDTDGLDHLVHTSQLKPGDQMILEVYQRGYTVQEQDQWRRVWEGFERGEPVSWSRPTSKAPDRTGRE